MKNILIVKKGFTLIEFLTVTVVIASIGLVVVGILTSSLRGTNKTNIVNTVRQNGNQAVSQMTRMIEYAKSFDGVSLDGLNYTVDCVKAAVIAPTPTPTPTQYKYLKITAFDGGEITYSCTVDSIASNSASLIDTQSVIAIQDKCWFTCAQDRTTSNPIIGIKFQLIQSVKSIFTENAASIPFDTSITFKNLIK